MYSTEQLIGDSIFKVNVNKGNVGEQKGYKSALFNIYNRKLFFYMLRLSFLFIPMFIGYVMN